ncbi:MAG: hypothetical protein COA38_21415 [Fluviicola sp.]|nr:MAG: hypothetical protein COA38_21415 [Fluviicola sp.]
MKALFYTGWFVVIFLAVCLAGIALSYFDFDLTKRFLGSKQAMIGNGVWLGAFYSHLFFGAVVTLIGIPLFFSKLIPFKAKLHKHLGKIYIGSILFVSGPTGLYLAFFAEGGQYSTIGFILMAMAWMIPTYIAFQRILKGDVQGHHNWMIRSYCMTLSGVTLRLFTPIASRYFDFDYDTTFILSAYVPWIINLLIGEVLVLLNKKRFHTLTIVS